MGNNQNFIIGIVEPGGCKTRRDMSIGSIWNAAMVSAAVVSLLVTACTAPEPAVERVEVTRVVDRIVEVPVTVPVIRIIEQTVEVQVNVPVTEVLEKTAEVTREVTRKIPVTGLVISTPPQATAAPSPAPTSRPTVAPAESLTETTLERMQVWFVNYGDHLRAKASPRFLILDAPDLDVFVDWDLVVDDEERCDTARIYWGTGDSEAICDLPFRSHTTVQRVSLQTPQGDLRCERDDFSDAVFTSFSCTRRE